MPVVPFGAWRPDQPALNNACITATNVYSAERGYRPFKDAVVVSDALPSACLGSASLPGFTVSGTDTKLFRLISGIWTDVSGKVYAAPQWRFTLFGQRVIATNGVDTPQKLDVGTDTLFSDLSVAPTHNFPFVVRDFLIASDVTDGSIFPLKFSARNNSDKWTAECGAGAQQFPDGGKILGGIGGEIGVVFQEKAITRMTFVGGEVIWQFDKLEGGIGAGSGDSIVGIDVGAFYFTSVGFAMFDGTGTQSISDKQVSRTLLAQLDEANVSKVRGALDPANQSVIWSYPISGGSKLVIYNLSENRWSEAELELSCLTVSQDDVIRGFNAANQLVELTGANLPATIGTGDIEIVAGQRSRIRMARVMTDASHTCTISTRSKLEAALTVNTLTPTPFGICNARSNDRFTRLQANLTGSWTQATGIDIQVAPGGARN